MVWSVKIDNAVREVLGLNFQTGSQRNANPQRPTGSWGRGRMSVRGYRTQTRKRVQVVVGGTDRIDAWAQNERYDEDTDISTYDIEGLLDNAARTRQEINQDNASTNANQAAVINKLRDAFGVTAIQSSLRSTPLNIYSFNGPAGGYASRFGLIAGGLPYATQKGLLGIKDPTRVPNTLHGTFGSNDYRIRDIVSNFDSNHLFNQADVESIVRTGDSNASLNTELYWRYDDSSDSISINLPVIDGVTYSNPRVTSTTPIIGTQTGRTSSASGLTNGQNLGPADSVSGTITGVTASIAGNVLTVRGSRPSAVRLSYLMGSNSPWGLATVSASEWATMARQSVSGGRIYIFSVLARVRVSYTINTADMPLNAQVGNTASITEWGPRPLVFPNWFGTTAESAVQSRINGLAQVRNLRTIEFYVDQRDTTKTNEVAAIEPGHYIALPDVGTIAYVMNVDWRLDSRKSPIKLVTCIDTGTDHTPTVPTNALDWRNPTNDLTWRVDNNYIEWSAA